MQYPVAFRRRTIARICRDLPVRQTLAMTGGSREQSATKLWIGERTRYRTFKVYGLKCAGHAAQSSSWRRAGTSMRPSSDAPSAIFR